MPSSSPPWSMQASQAMLSIGPKPCHPRTWKRHLQTRSASVFTLYLPHRPRLLVRPLVSFVVCVYAYNDLNISCFSSEQAAPTLSKSDLLDSSQMKWLLHMWPMFSSWMNIKGKVWGCGLWSVWMRSLTAGPVWDEHILWQTRSGSMSIRKQWEWNRLCRVLMAPFFWWKKVKR